MKERLNLSRHCLRDNFDRLFQINMTIGLGEIIHISPNPERYMETCVTDTGVIIQRGANGKIITMYIGTFNQIRGIYKGTIPKPLLRKVRDNEKRGYCRPY